MNQRTQPAVFISHGSPMAAIESGKYQDSLRRFGASISPTAILVVSAHWDSGDHISITSAQRNSLIYDFGGFPRELYQVNYEAPGAPELASKIALLLQPEFPVTLDPTRGLDHGAWAPLRLMFPDASIPIVELSIPSTLDPHQLVEIGRRLAPLRAEGILIVGSGGIVHNLRTIDFQNQFGKPEPWAEEFDRWFAEALEVRDLQQLFAYESAPHSRLAVPTPEHFVPVFVVLGAAENTKALEIIHEGFQYRTLSMRTFAFS